MKKMLTLIRKNFDKTVASHYDLSVPSLVSLFQGPKIITQHIGTNVSKIIYTFETFISSSNIKADATLLMLLKYFCSGYYSKLYQILREQHGLIYGLTSNFELSPVPNRVPGIVEIEIQTDQKNIPKVIQIINEQIAHLHSHRPSTQEMERVRNQVNSVRATDLLNKRPGKFVERYVQQVLWGKHPVTFVEYYKQLGLVRSRDVQQMSVEVFNPKHLLIAVGK